MGALNLDDIPAGSLCVVDTNVLVYAEQGLSTQAQRMLRRCGTHDLLLRLPQTVWHEHCHKLILAADPHEGRRSRHRRCRLHGDTGATGGHAHGYAVMIGEDTRDPPH